MRPLLVPTNSLRRTNAAYSSRASIYGGTAPHPIKAELRQRRASNAARNFSTGHWQHRVITAVPA